MSMIPEHPNRREIVLADGVGHADEVVSFEEYKQLLVNMADYMIFVVAGPQERCDISGSRNAVELVPDKHLAIKKVKKPEKSE